MEQFAVSLDVGGTFIKSALVAVDGARVAAQVDPTLTSGAAEDVRGQAAAITASLLAAGGVGPETLAGICLSLPGIVDHIRGVAISCPNLTAWDGVSFAPLAERLGTPVYVERDANMAAVGEAWLGAARGATEAVCFTLGTGIGVGLILNGRLYRGAWGGAGEIGHLIVDPYGPRCGCGNRGCLETLASAAALGRAARQAAGRAPGSRLHALSGGQPETITAETVFAAAAEGDHTAQRLLATAIEFLGIGVASVINALNPEVVVIGGGMAAAGVALLEPLAEVVRQRARTPLAATARLVAAELGSQAGVLGGAQRVFLGV